MNKKTPSYNKVIIIMFFIIIIAPGIFTILGKGEKTNTENRTLAKMPFFEF